MKRRAKRTLQIVAPALLLTAAPVAFSPREGLTENEACAQSGTCCPESGSRCIIGSYNHHDSYYKASGSCKINES